jgi:hypothetical protein
MLLNAVASYLLIPPLLVIVACRFAGDSNIELPCNEVTGPEQQRIAAMFDSKAQLWWSGIVAEPHSFTKLVFQLGLNGERASNIEMAGAIQLTRGNVHIKGSAVNFTDTGDRVCCQLQVRRFAALCQVLFCLCCCCEGEGWVVHCASTCS